MKASLPICLLPLLLCAAGCEGAATGPSAASATATAKGTVKPQLAPSPSATAASTAAAGAEKSCKDYGFEGQGTFSEPCKLKGPAPFTAKWTGKYVESFGEKKPEIEITSNFGHETTWGNVSLWYYDKDGKVLEHKTKDGTTFKRYYKNGSGVLPLKPKETKKLVFGVAEKESPKGTDSIEAEVTGFGWDAEPALYFDAYSEKTGLDDRPKGGWK